MTPRPLWRLAFLPVRCQPEENFLLFEREAEVGQES
jgi:hypothetical protein